MNAIRYFQLIVYSVVLIVSMACEPATEDKPMFHILDNDHTGIDFSNNIEDNIEINIFSYMYFYNGGGVGAGDFNNDGLIDLFFTANRGPNKLYLNKDNLQFRDVTKDSGIEHKAGGWSNGVSVVDINNDGLLDIYITEVGKSEGIKSKNQLLICQSITQDGIPIFKEKAEEYGLDQVGYGTQAVFFDYDLDGDLDLFQLNHSVHKNGTFGRRPSFEGTVHSLSGDRFFVNEEGTYVNRSAEVGIKSSVIGYGLGVVVGDVDMDGYPDIYVGNDFHENDYLYINQGDGTFMESLEESVMHTSKFTMGVDMTDINNDLLPDIISLDMLPFDPVVLKKSMAEDDPGLFRFKLSYGYYHQYSRNALQINNGDGSFSELGVQYGVHATDWSWSPLFGDLNLDGHKDLFVSNGIPKRMNDMDFIDFAADEDVRWRMNTPVLKDRELAYTEELPEVKIYNKIFLNQSGRSFTDIESQIGNNKLSFSNGAILADLDNDGDLDIVVNNINEKAYIYQNNTISEIHGAKDSSSLEIALEGSTSNLRAIGAKILLYEGGQAQLIEKFPVRGFQSSVEANTIIGVSNYLHVDSVIVVWPDGVFETRLNPNQRLIKFTYKKGLPKFDLTKLKTKSFFAGFSDITTQSGIDYEHKENSFVEFNREPLIPHAVSSEGPACAVGDLNGDGLDDIYFGSAKRERSKIYFQDSKGSFGQSDISQDIMIDSIYEDVFAEINDYNGDGIADLLVCSGGNEFWGHSQYLQPRLYIGTESGGLVKKEDAFNGIYSTSSKSASSDIDGDGDLDIFMGSRAVPKNYGQTPEAFLLLNDGRGNFTSDSLPGISPHHLTGFITDAIWLDINEDNKEDLILCKEWGGVEAMVSNNEVYKQYIITNKKGLWSKLLPYDFDQDGDIDIVALNLGLNSKFSSGDQSQVKMYYADFDGNGHKEQLVTYTIGGKETVFATKTELEKQLPSLKKKFLKARDFAQASITDLFDDNILDQATIYTLEESRSVVLVNNGDLTFDLKPLADEVQISFQKSGVLSDFNDDGKMDLLLGGNFYDNNIQRGRYDASYGHILLNMGNCEFEAKGLEGIKLKDQIRHIVPIGIDKYEGQCYVIAKNNAKSMVIHFNP